MVKKEIMIIADYSKEEPITLEELCEACQISKDFLYHLIEYQIIRPHGQSQDEWIFDVAQLRRVQTALRLQRDLEVNLAGIAVVLDLLEEVNEMREQMKVIERHFTR